MCTPSFCSALRRRRVPLPKTLVYLVAIFSLIGGMPAIARPDELSGTGPIDSKGNSILIALDAPQGSNESIVENTRNDALLASDGTLSLEQLVGEVIKRNPSVDQATQSLRAASERPEQKRALDDPMFTYMLGPGTLGSRNFDTAQKFEVSQSFPWPGKRRLRGEAAQHDADSMRGDLEVVREQLAYLTRAAYVDLWLVDRALEINARNQKLLTEFEKSAEHKYGAGLLPKQDAVQAKVEREMLRHDGLVLARNHNRAVGRINTLLNRNADAALPPPPEFLSDPVPPPALSELQAAAEENRPELRGIASRIHSAEARTSLARKEFYPDFSVMGSYDSFWSEKELKPSIGFSINLPIQVGRRRAAVTEAKAELASVEAQARKQTRDILLEVYEALEDVQESVESVTLYEAHLLPAAEENLESARSGYSSGVTDFLALVSAQKLLMDTTLRAKESLAAYHNGMAKLRHAIGKSITDSALAVE